MGATQNVEVCVCTWAKRKVSRTAAALVTPTVRCGRFEDLFEVLVLTCCPTELYTRYCED